MGQRGEDIEGRALARGWLDLMTREPRVEQGLEAVYAAAGAAIAARGPACWASGRCCNFERAGHRLYVTGLEAAYCVKRLGSSVWGAAGGAGGSASVTIEGRRAGDEHEAPGPSGRGLEADLAAAAARGGCPFQVKNLCGVHAIKPVGCRVYFCDRSAEAWQQELSERLLGEIRLLHERFGAEYRYGEWRAMLGMFEGV